MCLTHTRALLTLHSLLLTPVSSYLVFSAHGDAYRAGTISREIEILSSTIPTSLILLYSHLGFLYAFKQLALYLQIKLL